MKLHSYVVRYDSGFAPNPFWGYCTLSTCKPVIRRKAEVGDWIVGISPKVTGNKIIYSMQVEEILTYHEYFRDRRFTAKIPDYTKGRMVYERGDNIYKPLPNGDLQQLQSMHSSGIKENPKNKARDLRGNHVLISRLFYYFGSLAIPLPGEFEELKVGKGHKNQFPSNVVARFVRFITRQKAGLNGPPSNWAETDTSWQTWHP